MDDELSTIDYQWFIIDGMESDFWNGVREAIEWLIAQPDWSQARLAEEAQLSPSTIATFRAITHRGLQRKTWKKLKPTLLRYLPDDKKFLVANAGAGGDKPLQSEGSDDLVPIVDARRFPVELEGAEMLKRIRKSAHLWRSCSVKDPDAFGIQTTEPLWGEFWAGDVMIFSPATEPVDGEYIYARIGTKAQIVKYAREGDEKPSVLVQAGRQYTEFKRLGTLVDQWRPHLLRRPSAQRPAMNI